MATFLVEFTYTGQGIQGFLKEGGSKRKQVTEQLIKSLGGRLLAYYYTFGETDGFALVELPENADAAAAGLVVSGSGAVRTKTTVLITPEEMDRAVKKNTVYRAPGQ